LTFIFLVGQWSKLAERIFWDRKSLGLLSKCLLESRLLRHPAYALAELRRASPQGRRSLVRRRLGSATPATHPKIHTLPASTTAISSRGSIKVKCNLRDLLSLD